MILIEQNGLVAGCVTGETKGRVERKENVNPAETPREL